MGRCVLAVALPLSFLSAGAAGVVAPAAAIGRPAARAARTLNVTDTAHLRPVHKQGEYIAEEGRASGTLPGWVRLSLEVGSTVFARFTIETKAGSISGTGSGKPKGRSGEPSISGTMTVSHGTGRYKSAHGHGGFYGTINLSPRGPKSYTMVVQTTGALSY